MRVIVIGDVSWGGKYHLGDEAMTEVAIAELKKRGADVTLIAGTPEISGPFYDVAAVPRFGFRSIKERPERERFLASLVEAAVSEDTSERNATLDAVRRADAIVIAGGGNLNSSGIHHIFERVALKRIAEQLGIPLYVTSQTVGPHLLSEDRELVEELVGYATLFGARERSTAARLRTLCGETNRRIVQTFDDAVLLEASKTLEESQSDFDLPDRYVVGSFTFHAWSTGLEREHYYRELAEILDRVARNSDVEILLIPHMGSLEEPQEEIDDLAGHAQIVHYSQSGRISSLEMLAAKDVLSITQGALFTLSTRYHPTVFGVGLAVPALGLVTSYYSAIRMRGALANAGLESLAIPFGAWTGGLGDAVIESISENRDALAKHLESSRDAALHYQSRWWDAIVESIKDGALPVIDDVEADSVYEWGDGQQRMALGLARAAQEAVDLDRVGHQMQERRESEENAALRDRCDALEKELKQLKKNTRDLQKHVDRRFVELRHAIRPPGAKIRDDFRLKLRRLRGKAGGEQA